MKRPVRLRLDPIACDGRGLCAEVLPELIRLDDWGYPILAPGTVPDLLRSGAEEAVRLCPKLALRLEDAPGRQAQELMAARPSPRSGAGSRAGSSTKD